MPFTCNRRPTHRRWPGDMYLKMDPGNWSLLHVNQSHWQCCSTILDAARDGHVNCIRQRLARRLHSVTFDILEALHVGTSALLELARYGDVEALERRIRTGDDVNWQDAAGQTALHHAAIGEAEDVRAANCVRSLIAAGANVSVKNYLGETALHLAAIYGSVEVMKVLLSAKCDVNERNFEGSAALHYAVRSFRKQFETKKKQECVRLLLTHGASVNARTNDLWTPIHFACFIQRLRMGEDIEDAIGLIRILLEAGADITKRKESADLIAALCYCLEEQRIESIWTQHPVTIEK